MLFFYIYSSSKILVISINFRKNRQFEMYSFIHLDPFCVFRRFIYISVCLQCGRPEFYPWVGKIPWRRKWQPTPVFLPGESHGWWSLVGHIPRGRKESDTTQRIVFQSLLSRTITWQFCPFFLRFVELMYSNFCIFCTVYICLCVCTP